LPFADPHAANMLVRSHPNRPNEPQIVLLDHGLYRELTDDFRRHYTRLWDALVSGDVPEIKVRCNELNAGKAYALLASVLTFRSWDNITSGDMSKFVHQNQ
jgi:aarF domain-containing kinase